MESNSCMKGDDCVVPIQKEMHPLWVWKGAHLQEFFCETPTVLFLLHMHTHTLAAFDPFRRAYGSTSSRPLHSTTRSARTHAPSDRPYPVRADPQCQLAGVGLYRGVLYLVW